MFIGLPVHERKCTFCIMSAIDEINALLKCEKYEDIRRNSIKTIGNICQYF